MTGGAQDYEVFQPEAFRWRILGDMKQAVGLAVSVSVPHHEASVFAEMATGPTGLLYVSRDGAGALIRLQDLLKPFESRRSHFCVSNSPACSKQRYGYTNRNVSMCLPHSVVFGL